MKSEAAYAGIMLCICMLHTREFKRVNFYIKLLFCLLLATASARLSAAVPISPAASLQIGRYTVRYQNGFSLRWDDVRLAEGGLLQLFAPQYAEGYYSSADSPAAAAERLPDGGVRYTALFSYQSGAQKFTARQQISVHPGNMVHFSITMLWQGPHAALVEWNPMLLTIAPFLGAQYTAVSEQGIGTTGVLPWQPPTDAKGMRDICASFHTVVFRHTAIGTVILQSKDSGPVLGDGRKDPYLQDPNTLWPGLLGKTLLPGKPLQCSFTLRVQPDSPVPSQLPSLSAPAAVMPAALMNTAHAQTGLPPLLDASGSPVLVPQPKQTVWQSGRFAVQKGLAADLHIAGSASLEDGVYTALHALQKEIRQRAGTLPEVPQGRRHTVWIGLAGAQGMPAGAPEAPEHEEGYAIAISPQRLILVGRDAEGVQWGIETLRQLLQSNSRGAWFRAVHIDDWPSLRFRGAHLFVGRNALPFHEKLAARIFAPLKLNRVVLECEYTAWKSHPELHVPFDMSREDLRADALFFRLCGLQPIPLIATLGHCGWMFVNGQNRNMAEDPHKPFDYDVSNPAVYKLVFSIFREALQLFPHAKWFHIGHDEVAIPHFSGFGEYPYRKQNRNKGLVCLFDTDTMRLHNWLARHGVKTMLWGDMLLNSKEGIPNARNPEMSAANAPSAAAAKSMRAGLPHGMTLCDWRYSPGSEQRNGLAIFEKCGQNAIGCSWFQPENIRGWVQQIIAHHAKGLLQTTWAGYNSRAYKLETDYRQFTAFLYAAEYAWSGSDAAPDALPWRAPALFYRLYGHSLPPGTHRSGWQLNLDAAANCAFAGGDGLPWRITAPGGTEAGVQRLLDSVTGIAVQCGAGIALAGALQANGPAGPLPAAVSLAVGRKAEELGVLQALLYSISDGKAAASVTVVYADGVRLTVPLYAGRETAALNDFRPSQAYSTSKVTLQAGSTPVSLCLFRWKNPRPAVPIERIEWRTLSSQASPVLLGVTGVSEAEPKLGGQR